MTKELNPVEVTISNLVMKPELQPENLRGLFKKLTDLQPIVENIENSLAQTKQSMNSLMENRARVAGSMETLVSLLEEQLPKDIVEKFGKEYLKPEPK